MKNKLLSSPWSQSNSDLMDLELCVSSIAKMRLESELLEID